MKRFGWLGLIFVFVMMSASGCARVKTYTVEKDRVDQDLVSGNAGYLSGTPSEPTGERKLTRTTYVAEIELGRTSAQKVKGKKPKYQRFSVTPEEEGAEMQETMVEEVDLVAQEPVARVVSSVTYTVLPNDTLQKISQKFYQTTTKWKVIYDANKKVLKGPDRIYAGQVIEIPQE